MSERIAGGQVQGAAQNEQKRVPKLRFPEFEAILEIYLLRDILREKLSNGVFNDPRKAGNGFKIINVIDMYRCGTISSKSLNRVDIGDNEFSKNEVLFGDIFFTRSSLVKEGIAYSNVFLEDVSGVTFDGHLVRMRVDEHNFLPMYVYYLLRTDHLRRQLVARGKTGTMTTIGQEDIATVETYFPPLPEQKKIAAFLGAVDEKLAALRQRRDLLTRYKRGLMQKLFSQTLRFTRDDGTPFPDWEEKRLGDLGNFQGGGTPDTEVQKYWSGKIPWISSSDVFEDSINRPRTTRLISQQAVKETATKIIPLNSILIVSRVGVGKLAVSHTELCTSQDFCNFTPEDGNVKFIAYYLLHFKNDLVALCQGTSIKGLTTNDLKSLRIMFPHPDEQQKIAAALQAMDSKIDAVAAEIEQIETFKKALLQQMFV